MRIVIAVVITILVTAGGLLGVSYKLRGGITPPPETVKVRMEPVASGDLIELISAPGEIQPKTKVGISAKVAAPVVELPFPEGSKVTKGTKADGSDASIIVQLDDKDLKAALRSSQARRDAQEAQIAVSQAKIESSRSQIRSQRISLDDAERDFKRQLALLDTKDVSQSVVDTAQTKFDSLKAQLDAAEQQLESDQQNLNVMRHELEAADADVAKAKDELSYTTIRSPIDGVVTKLKAEVGEMVVTGTMNNAGTMIMEVADLDTMMMVARIDESSIAAVKPGQHAKVRIQAFPDDLFEGTVETVALARYDESSSMSRMSSDSGSSRYFEAKIHLKTEGRRIPCGLAADADIETKSHHGIRVPSQAVLGRALDALPPEARSKPEVDSTKSMTTVVFRCVGDKVIVTPVRVGPSDETHTLILAGLHEGDQVVTGPFKVLETIADGQTVKAESPPTTRPATQPAAAK